MAIPHCYNILKSLIIVYVFLVASASCMVTKELSKRSDQTGASPRAGILDPRPMMGMGIKYSIIAMSTVAAPLAIEAMNAAPL